MDNGLNHGGQTGLVAKCSRAIFIIIDTYIGIDPRLLLSMPAQNKHFSFLDAKSW